MLPCMSLSIPKPFSSVADERESGFYSSMVTPLSKSQQLLTESDKISTSGKNSNSYFSSCESDHGCGAARRTWPLVWWNLGFSQSHFFCFREKVPEVCWN